MAFKLAARKAFKAGMLAAKPALLEPVMNVEVQAPVEYAGDLMGDLNGRRGRIQGMDTKGSTQIIKAQVPMADMLSYQNDLISMTQGRASFQMEFSHYDYVPSLQADKILAASKAAKTGEKKEEEETRSQLRRVVQTRSGSTSENCSLCSRGSTRSSSTRTVSPIENSRRVRWPMIFRVFSLNI
jgi:hypothetical protein